MALKNFALTKKDQIGQERCENEDNKREPGVIYCNATANSYGCWPMTAANSFAEFPCAIFTNSTGNVTRFCHGNGTWDQFSNVSNCFDETSKPISQLALDLRRIILTIGYIVSLTALVASLSICFYFRRFLRRRNIIHCHLLLSFVLHHSLHLYLINVNDNFYINNNITLLCKVLYSCFNFADISRFFWMFVEGLDIVYHVIYLSDEKIKHKHIIAIGWGMPALVTLIWILLKVNFEPNVSPCWSIPIYFQLSVDLIFTVIGNLILLCNMVFLGIITWTFMTYLRTNVTVENVQTRKIVQTVLMLLPLLGIPYIIVVYRGTEHSQVINATAVLEALILPIQGICISLICCIWNGEVLAVVKKRYMIFQNKKKKKEKSSKQKSKRNEERKNDIEDPNLSHSGHKGSHIEVKEDPKSVVRAPEVQVQPEVAKGRVRQLLSEPLVETSRSIVNVNRASPRMSGSVMYQTHRHGTIRNSSSENCEIRVNIPTLRDQQE